MALEAVSFLLENLRLLALHEIDLYQHERRDFSELENLLSAMKAVLEDAANNPRKEEHFKTWERQLREVIYNAEDTIDSLITDRSWFNKARKVRTLLEQEVKPAFNKSMQEFARMPISETRGRGAYDVRDTANKAPRNDNVVGFEDEIDTLVKYMYEEAVELDVVSIIGMPGLGKTTVAWKIYNHPDIQHDFPIRIWIYVSQDFNRKEILRTIMEKFTMENLSTKSEDKLSNMVKEKLAEHKFILFMDDVWEPAEWNQIKSFLPTKNVNGKVVITSRNIKVGKISNDKRNPHKLRFLNDREGLELLQIEAFGKSDNFPEILLPTCMLIVEQCRGLPLAIIVIGGVLFEKRSADQNHDTTEGEWKKVSDSVRIYLSQGDKEKRMEKFILLSYNTLPYHLMNCFLYMGLFPEDAAIIAWKLRQMWIAEGYILQKPGKTLEEVAYENLKELIDRNLVQVDTIKPNGEVKTCRLHDTIREFCNNEAAAQNLFQEISKSKEGGFQPSIDIVSKYRRLCIHSNIVEILPEYFKKKQVPKARAILLFSKKTITLDNKVIPKITVVSDLLRVLEMSSTINFPKFPKVTQLILLRYISLSGDEFKILPDISVLWNLQTILVATLSRTLEVKANLWKMVQLRHFKTKASVILKSGSGNGEGGGTLQTLGRLSPESCTEDVFKKAKNLNTLGIRGDLDKVVFNTNSFVSLGKLEKLKLYHDVFPKAADENGWKNFPAVDKFPTHLKSLTLKQTYLEWSRMSFIGSIPTLEVLKLKDGAFEGKSWERMGNGGFARLRFLHIERIELLVWEAAPRSFPRLKNLVIKNCENLGAVPSQVVENLYMMYLERVKKSIATSAREIAEKKNKGLRIPAFKLVVKSVS